MSALKLDSTWNFRLWNPKTGEVRTERKVKNLRTNAGRDWIFGQILSGTPVASTGFNYIALSTDATGGTATSTTLTSEVTTNGLQRALGTYNHVAGQYICTLAHSFTCTTSPVTVQSAALFTAASSGTINHIVAFTAIVVPVGWTLSVTITLVASGAILTTLGIDWIFAQVYSGTPTISQGLNYISLSTATSGGDASSTGLVLEIVGTGLDRALATYAHTTNTATATLARTFTYSGAGSAQLRSAALNLQAYPTNTAGIIINYALTPEANGTPFTVTFTITVA
jgi:hypothetical protein